MGALKYLFRATKHLTSDYQKVRAWLLKIFCLQLVSELDCVDNKNHETMEP